MSRHISRKSRWTQVGPNEYRSDPGRVYFRAGQWHAELIYRIAEPDAPLLPEPETWIAGQFKRPRNAMIALEDKVTELRRRYGENIVFVSTP